MQFKVTRNIGANTVREYRMRHELDIDQWREGESVDLDEKAAAQLLKDGLIEAVGDKPIEAVPATGGDVGAAEPPHKKHK